jgi:hypothetical protein
MKKLSAIFIILFSFSTIAKMPDIIALVNDEPITKHEFEARKKLAIVLGNVDNSTPEKDKQLNDNILNILIMEELLDQHAKKIGGQINDTELNNAIIDIEKRNNMQSGQLFIYMMEKGADISSFKKQLRSELIKHHIASSLSNSVSVSPTELDIAIINSGAKDFMIEGFIFTALNNDSSTFGTLCSLKKKITSCDKLSEKLYSDIARVESISGKLSTFTPKTQSIIQDTKVGSSSTVYKEDSAFKIALVCKKEALVTGDELNSVTTFISNKKMSQKAQKFFKDLRSKAYIQIMLK